MSSPNKHTAEKNALTALAALENLVKRLTKLIADTERKANALERTFREQDEQASDLTRAEVSIDPSSSCPS